MAKNFMITFKDDSCHKRNSNHMSLPSENNKTWQTIWNSTLKNKKNGPPPLIWKGETKFQMLLGLGWSPTVQVQRPKVQGWRPTKPPTEGLEIIARSARPFTFLKKIKIFVLLRNIFHTDIQLIFRICFIDFCNIPLSRIDSYQCFSTYLKYLSFSSVFLINIHCWYGQ